MMSLHHMLAYDVLGYADWSDATPNTRLFNDILFRENLDILFFEGQPV